MPKLDAKLALVTENCASLQHFVIAKFFKFPRSYDSSMCPCPCQDGKYIILSQTFIVTFQQSLYLKLSNERAKDTDF